MKVEDILNETMGTGKIDGDFWAELKKARGVAATYGMARAAAPLFPADYMTTMTPGFEKPGSKAAVRTPPAWAETSVRWLRETHPRFLRGVGARHPFVDQLIAALENMAFRAYTSVADFETTAWAWNRSLHEQMVAWISDGHPERVMRERKAEATAAAADAISARRHKPESVFVGDERIDLEGEDADLLDSVVGALKSPSQLSPEHELQEAVNTALRQEDKRYGSW